MKHEFDIPELLIGTLAFCFNENAWRGADDYESDQLSNTGDNLYSFKDGELWLHNIPDGPRNMFYGIPVNSFLGISANPEGGKEKIFLVVSVESNFTPKNCFLKTEEPKLQFSKIPKSRFKRKGPAHYADVLRQGPNEDSFSFTGLRMRGTFMICLFEFETSEELRISAINVGSRISPGNEFL